MAEITATLNGETLVTWRDGVLSGGVWATQMYVNAAYCYGTRLGPPEGPHSFGNHLDTPLGVMLIASMTLPEGVQLQGDLPPERESTDDDGREVY